MKTRALAFLSFALPLLCGCGGPRCVATASGAAAAAAGTPGASFSGAELLGPAALRDFVVQGDAKKVAVTPISVSGQPFSEALRAEIRESSNSDWTVQLQAPTAAAVEKGDVLLATFYTRATKMKEDGGAETQFVFERAGEPFVKSVSHPVEVGKDWRKSQVRFVAAESYGPGKAHAIFRLGYDPETLEIAGVSIQNFGKSRALTELPTTETQDRVSAAPPPPLPAAVDGGSLKVEVNAGKVIGRISPYVYGINSQNAADVRPTLRRMGGNRQTVYNWELNASNAGSDWKHVNDDWPCTNLGYQDCDKPGAQMTNFVQENQRGGMESLLTIPMIDYASADKKQEVSEQERAPSPRFVRSLPRKKGALSLNPDLQDGTVYQDELVNFLVQKFGRASGKGVKFYSLDNEPALWPGTHPRVHPEPTSYKEILDRTDATAAMITELDPSAIVLGGVSFGWSEFMSLQSAPDSKQENAKIGGIYLDFLLSSFKKLEEKHRRRLVHVLDVHWYPEVKGRKRITENDTAPKTIEARLSAPRSFWDPSYREKSWIDSSWGKPIRLIPWLKELVNKHYPGTRLSMTEYNFGAGDHISGGLAQVDVLGIFGREGLFMANYWGNGAGVGTLPPFVAAAFKLYRNYDGKGGSFGDTAVAASLDDLAKGSVFAATDSARPNQLTLLVINKDLAQNVQAEIKIQGKKCAAADAYALAEGSSEIRAIGKVNVTNDVLSYRLPRLSATLFVCR